MNGIKTIDIKIKSSGHGVVNWNGPTQLMAKDGSWLKNHTMPKLIGYTSYSGKKNDKGTDLLKSTEDIDFSKNPLYISSNCIKHFLFKEQSYDLHFVDKKDFAIQKYITSLSGLFRGYVVANQQIKRKASLSFESFIDQLGNGTFEQFTNSADFDEEAGKKGSTSLFSRTTFGDTEYIGYASINIEDLQFLSLDGKFDRKMAELKDKDAQALADNLVNFINSIDDSKNPTATLKDNYVRLGSIYSIEERGILLNEDALEILVAAMLEKIENLYIRQSQGWMCVDEILVDYNDSNKIMRIKKDESSISEVKNSEYAVYFQEKQD